MFSQRGIKCKHYRWAIRDINKYDVAIYGALVNKRVLWLLDKHKILKISLAYHLISEKTVSGTGFTNSHYTICLGDDFSKIQSNNGVKHEFLPFGSPQLDVLNSIQLQPHHKDCILIIDQHYYPAGNLGKTQYAQMIVDLAASFPDEMFIVKPRTIPSQVHVSKHKSEHIYSYIDQITNGNLPNNLQLLDKHIDLNELAKASSTIITGWTTAIFTAIVLNKPLIIYYGFDHIDLSSWNNNAINLYYDYLKKTGKIVHYSEVVNGLNNAAPINREICKQMYHFSENGPLYDIFEFIEYVVEMRGVDKKSIPYLGLTSNNYKERIAQYFNCNENNIHDDLYVDGCNYLRKVYNKMLSDYHIINLKSGYLLSKEYDHFQQRANGIYDKFLDNKVTTKTEQYKKLYEEELDQLFNEQVELNADKLISGNTQLPDGFIGWYLNYMFKKQKFDRIKSLRGRYDIPDLLLYNSIIDIKEKTGSDDTLKDLRDFIAAYDNAEYRTSEALKYGKSTAEIAIIQYMITKSRYFDRELYLLLLRNFKKIIRGLFIVAVR